MYNNVRILYQKTNTVAPQFFQGKNSLFQPYMYKQLSDSIKHALQPSKLKASSFSESSNYIQYESSN